ncbi:hypothetical protein FLP41_03525 (plasmid) [Paracoccus marcusii]|nr:hypothetical protein FLP41_03525 [Paracoccus marcusii]
MTSILQAANAASSGDWSGLSSDYREQIQAAAQTTMIGAGLDPARVEAMGQDGSVAENARPTKPRPARWWRPRPIPRSASLRSASSA